jgi:hypothetical protein
MAPLEQGCPEAERLRRSASDDSTRPGYQDPLRERAVRPWPQRSLRSGQARALIR